MKTSTSVILVLAIAMIIPFFSFSQTTFERVYYNPAGESLTAGYFPSISCREPDGDYIIVGSRGTGVEGGNLFYMRINEFGDTLVTKNIMFGPNTISRNADGGFLMTSTDGIAYVNWNAYVALIRMDINGDTIWTRKIGDNPMNYNSTYGSSSCQTASGNFFSVGSTDAWGVGGNDVYLIKSAADGSTIWKKTLGTSASESGKVVKPTMDNGIIIGGNIGSDLLLAKLDSNGTVLWSKSYANIYYETFYDLAVTSDHGFLVTGYTNSFGLDDGLILKTDSAGNIQWCKTLGNTGQDMIWSSKILSDDGFAVTGYTTDTATDYRTFYLARFDSDGDTLWTRKYGDGQIGSGVSITENPDGSFFLTGQILINPGTGNGYHNYFIRTDSMGRTDCSQSSANLFVIPQTFTASNVTLFTSSGGDTKYIDYCPTFYTGLIGAAFCYPDEIGAADLIEFSVFPNPATDNITIANENLPFSVEIWNVSGRKMFSEYADGNSPVVIDVSWLSKGLYFVKVIYSSGVKTEKIVKE